MKTNLFRCRDGIDTIDAFVVHLQEAAQQYEARYKRYIPIDYHDGTVFVGVEGAHAGGYWFVSQPRLENGTIVLEGKIEKHFHKIPYSNRLEKAIIVTMGITVYVGFWLPILISTAVRSFLRRRLLKRFLLTYAGCTKTK